jgi:hypothetical protein
MKRKKPDILGFKSLGAACAASCCKLSYIKLKKRDIERKERVLQEVLQTLKEEASP